MTLLEEGNVNGYQEMVAQVTVEFNDISSTIINFIKNLDEVGETGLSESLKKIARIGTAETCSGEPCATIYTLLKRSIKIIDFAFTYLTYQQG